MYCITNSRGTMYDGQSGYIEHQMCIKYYNANKIVFKTYFKEITVTSNHLESVCNKLSEAVNRFYNQSTNRYITQTLEDSNCIIKCEFMSKSLNVSIFLKADNKQMEIYYVCSIEDMRYLYKLLKSIVINNGSIGIKECDEVTEADLNNLDYYNWRLGETLYFLPTSCNVADFLCKLKDRCDITTKKQSNAIKAIYEQYELERRSIEKVKITTRKEATKFINDHKSMFDKAKNRHNIKIEEDNKLKSKMNHDEGYDSRDEHAYFSHVELF